MPEDDALLAATVEGIARLTDATGPPRTGASDFSCSTGGAAGTRASKSGSGGNANVGSCMNSTACCAVPQTPPFCQRVARHLSSRLASGTSSRWMPTRGCRGGPPAAWLAPWRIPSIGRRFDPRVGRVVEGYAVLQPRVTPTLPTDREGSLFQRIFSGPCGIDPYASAVSDVYQDLFGEGSYTGKGIYDIDAFEAALAGRVPENALLSHDLFEGIFARAGLVTDIEFFDEFPSHYEVAAARQHRWARGDWQLLPWIIGRARDTSGARVRTSISLISRWKMLDNLRRTLSAPAAFLTLMAGWTLPFASPVIWTTFVLATIALPALLPVLDRADPASPRDFET